MQRADATVNQERRPGAALRRFAQPRVRVERCELCSVELPPEHEHLVEPGSRSLLCACQACAMLFTQEADIRYRRVPRRVRYLADFQLSDAEWNGLNIPIGLAFFFHSTSIGKIAAIYPSPAGPTESLLDLAAWDDLVRENPVLADMAPDVEALLVNRVGRSREHLLAPIDACYQLIGLIRSHWQGFSGGDDVWREIETFFGALKRRAGVEG